MKESTNSKIDLLIKENKEMKEKINYLENLLNINFGVLKDEYFEKIKEWIGGDKNKIKFDLIYEFQDENSRDIFNKKCNVSKPVIFLFITTKNSIFGAYCPNFNTSSNQWIDDSNAFIFSLNLNKKYPAKNNSQNYHRGTCGVHFQDITFCGFNLRKGTLGKGNYLNELELEDGQDYFIIRHFYVYLINRN